MAEYKPNPRIRGSANGKALLSAGEVIEIHRLLRAGMRATDIARQFGVSAGAIWHIASGRDWGWLKDAPPLPAQPPEPDPTTYVEGTIEKGPTDGSTDG